MTESELPTPPLGFAWESFPEIDGVWLVSGSRLVASISDITQSRAYAGKPTVRFQRDYLATSKPDDIVCETAEQAARAAFAAFGY